MSEEEIMGGYREQFGSGLVDTRISNRESEVRKPSFQIIALNPPYIYFA